MALDLVEEGAFEGVLEVVQAVLAVQAVADSHWDVLVLAGQRTVRCAVVMQLAGH